MSARGLLEDARRELVEATVGGGMSAARAEERYSEIVALISEDLPGWEDYAACLAFAFRALAYDDPESTASIIGRVLDYIAVVVEELGEDVDVIHDDVPAVDYEIHLLEAALRRVEVYGRLTSEDVWQEVERARERPVPSLPPFRQ